MSQSIFKIKKTETEIFRELPILVQEAILILKSYGFKRPHYKINRKGIVKRIRLNKWSPTGLDSHHHTNVSLHLKDRQISKITTGSFNTEGTTSFPSIVIEIQKTLNLRIQLPNKIKCQTKHSEELEKDIERLKMRAMTE